MDYVIEEMNLETLESRLEMESVATLAAQPSALINCLCFQKN
jgi:hypothetical protein